MMGDGGGNRARVRADHELRESEALLRALVENAYDTIALFDKTGRFVYASPNHETVFGWRVEELLGRSCLPFIHPDERDNMTRAFHAAGERATPGESLFRWRCRDGSYRWLESTARAHRNADGEPRVVTVSRDVTERRRAEERLRHAKRVEEIGLLAGGIAHDFNNLLTTIQGNVSLALAALPGGDPREYLQDIEAAARRASDLTHQMLAYTGQRSFAPRAVDLTVLVREVSELLRSVVSKKARLVLELAEDLPPVEGDASQLHQVAMNLIVNASDALDGEPGEVRVRTGRSGADARGASDCTLGDPPEGDVVFLEVSDTGQGLTAEMQQLIFEPFFTTKPSGRGLGLAAVSGILLSHGGALQLESEPGRGSTFRVLLPASARAAEQPRDDAGEGDGWRGEGTVLLADDESAVLRTTERMLRRLGFEVVCATNGREALDLYERRPEAFRLVMLDLTMPVMGGREACQAIRETRPEIPVILASGYHVNGSRPDDAPDARLAMLQKPYRLSALRETLRDVLAP